MYIYVVRRQRVKVPVLHVSPRTAVTLILRLKGFQVPADKAVAGQRSKKAQMTLLLKKWFALLNVFFLNSEYSDCELPRNSKTKENLKNTENVFNTTYMK